MGNFYTNITVLGPTQDALLKHLKSLGRDAYVSQTVAGVTVVYDRECEEQQVGNLHALSHAVTEHFQCRAASALVHDDSVLFFAACDRGELVTEFDSSAGRHVRPLLLCHFFGVSVLRAPLVWLALVRPHLLYLFEVLRHARLVRLLGLSDWAVGTGYKYIARGERPNGLEPVHTRGPKM